MFYGYDTTHLSETMSLGCGTLANPAAFNLGAACASSSNGQQHTLPENPHHERIEPEDIEAHWSLEGQKPGPTRLWGEVKATKYGGEERVDGVAHQWLVGDYWNVNSNIRKWTLHEVKRNAAAASHDVHRHDQITRIVLPPPPGSDKPPRQCVSGVVSPDCCFLEAWGFDLGLRDRQARPAPLWKPVNSSEQFRSTASFDRNTARMAERYRTLRKSSSVPGTVMVQTLRPDDKTGQVGEASVVVDDRVGTNFGSRSCIFWDRFDHTCRREAAKMSCTIHSPALKEHSQGYPFKDMLELNPASVYTRKYRLHGEDSLKKHLDRSLKVSMHR